MAREKKVLKEELLVLAYNIKKARADKYKSITEAANVFKGDGGLWRRWENAAILPHKPMLHKVAKFLGVTDQSLHTPPDDWENIKVGFLQDLIRRTKTNKDYYMPLLRSFKIPEQQDNDGQPEQLSDSAKHATPERKHDDGDLLNIFLQITRLITDARNKAHEVDRETYDMHMRTIVEIAKLSLLAGQ